MLRTFQGRLQWRLTFLNESRNVFDHDDRIVDDEARRNRQCHQRQVVQAEPHQIHEAECTDKRQGNRDAGNDGRRKIPQKQKHHHHDESDREHQFELHVCYRSSNRRGAVGQNREVHQRQRGLELWQDGLDAIHHRNDVGSRLPLNVHNHCRLVIHPRGLFRVLNVIHDSRHIGQPNGRAFTVCNDDLLIVVAREDLIVRPDGEYLQVTFEVSFGLIDIGPSQRAANIFKAQAVSGKSHGDDLNSHTRFLSATDPDESDPRQL